MAELLALCRLAAVNVGKLAMHTRIVAKPPRQPKGRNERHTSPAAAFSLLLQKLSLLSKVSHTSFAKLA